jgi:hypothetical protein
MYLIQILLPTTNPSASEPVLAALNRSLVEKFGGVTAYTQAPAKGNWLAGGAEERDDIIIIEAMADDLDHAWWKLLRKRLERDLQQKEIVIRSQLMERL